jgi:endonuclease YncB( thermonuclease family)
MSQFLFYFTFIILSLFPIETAFAHGGGLDGLGCHHNRKAGGYHCHRGSMAGQHFRSKNEAVQKLRVPTQPPPSKASPEQLSGIPKITDGDTIRIGSTRIRLHGIDAPETKQTCTINGKEWRCGWEATNALANIVGKHWVTCTKRDIDRYGRVVAVCRAGPINLNAWMVSNGWAVAYRRYSKDYVRDESDAKAGRKGMWKGEFMMPWDWRRK